MGSNSTNGGDCSTHSLICCRSVGRSCHQKKNHPRATTNVVSAPRAVLVAVGRVKSGSLARVVVMIVGLRVVAARVERVARAKSGSLAKAVVMIVGAHVLMARAKSGNRVKVVVMIVGARVLMARAKSGSLVKVVVMIVGARVVTARVERVARAKSGNRAKVVVMIAVRRVVMARVVSGSLARAVVMIVVRRVETTVAMIAAAVTVETQTFHKPKRSVAGLRCSLAKVRVNTAKTSHLVIARTVKSGSSTKVQCVDANSIAIAVSHVSRRVGLPAASRAHHVVMTGRCSRRRQRCKSRSPARFVVPSATGVMKR